MILKMAPPARRKSLRSTVIASILGVVLVSFLGSLISVLQVSAVSRDLEQVNRVGVPMGKLLGQLSADAEVLLREVERNLGPEHWSDPRWHARPIPKWLHEVITSELERVKTLADTQGGEPWQRWARDLSQGFRLSSEPAAKLYGALEARQMEDALAFYRDWRVQSQAWRKLLQWGTSEFERSLRESFATSQSRVNRLRTGLELILGLIVLLSLLFLWIGERALRPLGELTQLARGIAQRGGLRREDKSALPQLGLHRTDEVAGLAREFHRMATALLEREKTVELQKARLQEQNRLLRQMGELQQKLQRAENLASLGRMSAQVAHEVRNPLHSIGLEAELALETVQGAPPLLAARAKQSIQSILASVERLTKITENYLKLSRLSRGEKRRIDLGDVLEATLATYAPAIEASGVLVGWRRETDVHAVIGDVDLLEQALGNLLRNSMQAMASQTESRADSKIDLELLGAPGEPVRLRITDNGPGIPSEIRAQLFRPFMTSKADGTGLGLSFARQVLEDHGGELRCIEVPHGACFELTLPPAPLPEVSAPQSGPEWEVLP